MRRLAALFLALTVLGAAPVGARAPQPIRARGGEGAVAVVRAYYAALAERDYRRAYALWGDDGRASGKSFAAFAAGLVRTARTDVAIGRPGEPEGAAGSTYIEIPVTVRARLRDGTRQRFAGRYTLRRVNDVPGSSAKERRWHIYSARLRAR